ncbi:MAG: D-alanyl-D-alanine carboxypeptidase family protein [Hyphomicrobiaceae bacterium]
MRGKFVFAAFCAWLTLSGLAQAAPKEKPADGPSLVFDAKDGRVLWAEHADVPWYPASLTKLMTAYVVFDLLKRGEAALTSEFVVSPHANSQPKSRVGLGVGKRISVKDALNVLIVHSANDIAVALAEAVAGSEEEFVLEMNQIAMRLGMLRTRFVNANGLPKEGQATTARDMALLARALIRDFPEWLPIYAQSDVQLGSRSYHTHNKLLDLLDGADGMKTGFTCGAGYNIVASATREGRKIVAVVLGDRNGGERSARAMRLIEAGFATPAGGMINAASLEPEPVSGEALVDAPLFAEARILSSFRPVKNCFAPAGPSPKVVQEIAEHKPVASEKKRASAK